MNTPGTRSPSTNLSRRDRFALFLEHEGNKRLRSLGTALYRLTSGRFTPRSRDVLLLTTRGQKSGREHTVLVQGFRDGASLVLAAVNAGRPSDPDWFRNLETTPEATVELKGRTFRVRAERLSAEEAASWWPQILRRAPSYDLFLKASGRAIPLVRLTPIGSATASRPAAGVSRNAGRQPTEIARVCTGFGREGGSPTPTSTSCARARRGC